MYMCLPWMYCSTRHKKTDISPNKLIMWCAGDTVMCQSECRILLNVSILLQLYYKAYSRESLFHVCISVLLIKK